MYYSYFLILLFFSGIFIFVSKNKHFLLMLLSLEFVVLALYVFMFLNFSFFNFEYFLSMFFLSMSVCESALGLSLLVLMSRTQGSDKILLLDNLW
uniref:NADH-ubiquinone oxidoreductase chain 4L n=1 Tax=Anthonomus pomorum TaxID=201758 RepID=J9PJM6_9CUCU|nr:NADH dehydrogenase subunit 4L [Anthonomus pomorum]AEP27519.1 NADH dehydrogenase subunit 4L [Anthonomus pomorum]QED57671.1 NADH dehydrogenase subunit 4L [Anthonomus pomorum]QED57679.1 NADH dehydrogenase subunit 4L [Anthonomus pomorum]QED57692.1 NADH dehydrogenase subunit 4L [Anthonomus pomorum]QED57763.1 NADH dehydrogenase subunit 4L [Anthonomus pomorum]